MSFRLGGMAILWIAFSIFLLVGLAMVIAGWGMWSMGKDFAAHGVNTEGRIERLWESTYECKDTNASGKITCTDYNVAYSYQVDGKSFAGEGTTDVTIWKGLEEGAIILVRYLPDRPESSATSYRRDMVDAAGGMDVAALVFGGLGGAFALVGGGGIGFQIRRLRQSAWFRANGTKRGAVVTAKEETSISVNNDRHWRITWQDDTGATGKSGGRIREDLPEVGQRIFVYVDPHGTRGSVWEGDL